MIRITVKELMNKHGVDYTSASGFLKFLESLGIAKVVDKVKTSTGKGKPALVYEISSSVTINL